MICEEKRILGNSLKLWRLSPHRSRQHSNPSNWNNLETDDFVRQIWQTTKTCSASSNTSSSSSRRVLSMGSCGRNIYQKNNTMTLTCPRPLRRLTTLVMLSRSKSRMRPAFGVSWLSNLSGRETSRCIEGESEKSNRLGVAGGGGVRRTPELKHKLLCVSQVSQ